jgi:hypothetical protein
MSIMLASGKPVLVRCLVSVAKLMMK